MKKELQEKIDAPQKELNDLKRQMNLLEVHRQNIEIFGFWTEEYLTVIMKSIELRHNTEIIREWSISDFVVNGDKVLVKWVKRFQPLSDMELKEQYGR